MTRPLERLRTDLRAALARAHRLHHPGDVEQFRAMRQLLNAPQAPDPYARTTVRGKVLDNLTHYALLTVEHRLGYKPGSLTVVQGSYNGGAGEVDASGNTHDGGGAVDLTAQDWQAKVHALRAVGFAAWHRPELRRADGSLVWREHVHAVLVGNAKLSPAAKDQVADYLRHRDGLATDQPDPTWHPDPQPRYTMPIYRMED